MNTRKKRLFVISKIFLFCLMIFFAACSSLSENKNSKNTREKVSINEGWKFFKYKNSKEADHLIYDERPDAENNRELRVADAKPTEAVEVESKQKVLKDWILPSANDFIKNPENHYSRPDGNPGADFSFVQANFDDSNWENVDLPHDWAISGPFQEGWDSEVGGGMGRLPSNGVAWYRRKLDISKQDENKSVFIQIDGAMSYSMVWLNGNLVGGWPYGYNSYQLDLTQYLNFDGDNQLAIRLDNPNHSARWYPGGGLYRNVWLIKTHKTHVAQWGTYITTRNVSEKSANIHITVTVENNGSTDELIEIESSVFSLYENGAKSTSPEITFPKQKMSIQSGQKQEKENEIQLNNPKLWEPLPTQTPNLYVAVTKLIKKGKVLDEYQTQFGIRKLKFDPNRGVLVNDELIKLQGVNQHHDLGALGAAFNKRAAKRQLEILKEMGCNAVRMAHNPPAPELLDLCDKMGFLVINEIFDVWERKKTAHDFHLIFPDWHEADIRSFIRRDRNHPSIIAWSYGNEVGEQYTEEAGANLSEKLRKIVNDEDPTRPATASMNYARPRMPFPATMELISLNYQGEGIRNAPAYKGLQGINTHPLYPEFHEKFPDKVIVSSENAAALSTRGTYLFPVYEGISAPVKDYSGGDPSNQFVSAYELYTAPFGSSADKVFASLDKHPYVAGGFVWSGWDYLGEPTPYYSVRSSYYGVIDLAGFKKDRFYLYQSYWRPDLPMAHILPHWNWPNRIGKITPVHVFTSGDEAELFLNGESLGRKKKAKYEYRLRWDDVKYEPGELKVFAYKNGEIWAKNTLKTTKKPAKLVIMADKKSIKADGDDLAFVILKIQDENGLTIPNANNEITFSIEGLGKIIATDNGDPRDLTPFPSLKRKAFNGLALAIVQANKNKTGTLKITAESDGLDKGEVEIKIIE